MSRILIIEDEPHIVMSLEFLMTQAGHEVQVVTDGSGAGKAIASFAPDLILLDIMLPGVSGFDICRTVRAEADSACTKVVMLSARGRQTEIDRGLASGADAYVTKPFDTKELMLLTARLLAGEDVGRLPAQLDT